MKVVLAIVLAIFAISSAQVNIKTPPIVKMALTISFLAPSPGSSTNPELRTPPESQNFKPGWPEMSQTQAQIQKPKLRTLPDAGLSI